MCTKCSTYKQLEQDLAMPLAQKTSHLKAERLQLMRRISSLTKEVRAAYDKLHPGEGVTQAYKGTSLSIVAYPIRHGQ